MKPAKPHLRMRLDGHIEVLRVGNLTWTEADARSFLVALSGSLQNYCRRMRLNYGEVCKALRPAPFLAYYGAGSVSYIRLLFGLAVQPDARASRWAMKRGNTRVLDLLAASQEAQS